MWCRQTLIVSMAPHGHLVCDALLETTCMPLPSRLHRQQLASEYPNSVLWSLLNPAISHTNLLPTGRGATLIKCGAMLMRCGAMILL